MIQMKIIKETVIPFPNLFYNSVILTTIHFDQVGYRKNWKIETVINVLFSWLRWQESYNTSHLIPVQDSVH